MTSKKHNSKAMASHHSIHNTQPYATPSAAIGLPSYRSQTRDFKAPTQKRFQSERPSMYPPPQAHEGAKMVSRPTTNQQTRPNQSPPQLHRPPYAEPQSKATEPRKPLPNTNRDDFAALLDGLDDDILRPLPPPKASSVPKAPAQAVVVDLTGPAPKTRQS